MSAEHSKRSIAFLLALSMVLTIIPVQAFSAESDTQIHIEETEPVRETEAEAESIADNTEICISDQTEAVEVWGLTDDMSYRRADCRGK